MKRIGSKSEVYFGHAKQTKKGETREHLIISPKGNIILKTSLRKTVGAGFFNGLARVIFS
jgi:hypothetical protein